MVVKCAGCGATISAEALATTPVCPDCARPLTGVTPSDQQASSNSAKLALELPKSLQGEFLGIVVSRRGRHVLRTDPIGREWKFRLIDRSVRPKDLVGEWWYYRATKRVGKFLFVQALRPKDPIRHKKRKAFRQKRDNEAPSRVAPTNPVRTFDGRSVASEAFEKLGPVPIGTSLLEVHSTHPRVVEKIQQLAQKKDDPFAWRLLALGYRSNRIREPIKRALRDVGADKVLRLIRWRGGDWGGVVEFLESELAVKKTTVKTKKHRENHLASQWEK